MKAWWERQHVAVRWTIILAAMVIIGFVGGEALYHLGYAIGRWSASL